MVLLTIARAIRLFRRYIKPADYRVLTDDTNVIKIYDHHPVYNQTYVI